MSPARQILAPDTPETATEGPTTGGRRPRLPAWWPVPAVGVVALVLTGVELARVPIYLTADAGHYLADADAVFGQGVRESRHLPLFPLLVGVLRIPFGDLGGATAAMIAVLALLVVGFHEFVGRRLASPGAEAVGGLFFILSPVFAEGVGWYGASMLMGLALALVAMRFLDDVLVDPRPRRVAAAGVVAGLVGLTHPLPFLVLAQVSLIAGGILIFLGARRLRREGQPAGAWVRRRILAAAATAAVAAAVVLPWLSFYTRLESPVVLSFNPSQLATLSSWAFREDLPLWIGLVAVSGVILLGGTRRLHGEAQLRMAVWALVACAVPLVTVLLVSGNPSYTSRYLYLLPLTLGCTVAVGCAVLLADLPALARRTRVLAAALMALALAISAVRAGQSYTRRLEVALDYYSDVSTDELAAIRWLRDRPGTVAVTAKGGDKVAGTLYAWMIEGLATKRAIGTDRAFLAMLESAHRDSVDVERMLAGSAGVENGRLRLAGSEGDRTPVEVAGRVGGDWFPLFSLDAGPAADPAAPDRAAAVATPGGRGELDVEHHGVAVRGLLDPTRPGDIAFTVEQRAPGAPLAVDLRPSLAAAPVSLRAAGGEATISLILPGGAVRAVVTADGALPLYVENDARSGTGRVRIEADPGRSLALTVRLDGLDDAPSPALSTYRDTDIIGRHRVQTVFTWKQTGVAGALTDRRCFRPLTENDEVVILGVTDACGGSR